MLVKLKGDPSGSGKQIGELEGMLRAQASLISDIREVRCLCLCLPFFVLYKGNANSCIVSCSVFNHTSRSASGRSFNP